MRTRQANPLGPLPTSGLLGFSRCGFEADLVEELKDLGADHADLVTDGLVQATSNRDPTTMPVFARDLLRVSGALEGLTRGDRIGPIAAHLRASAIHGDSLILLAADSESGRKLAPMLRSMGRQLANELSLPLVSQSRPGSVIVVFVDSTTALLAQTVGSVSNPWPGGIARLKMPHGAPSRSTLKLDEAFALMLTAAQRSRWLRAGMRAVDLGAAPGGWSWQLVNRGMSVTAIDNGPIKGELQGDPLLTHLRADGFRWQPPRPVDWLVCDMVAKPARVVERIALWLSNRWCARALFNLKLPMQSRYQSWLRLREQLLQQCRLPLQVQARHLYHDREEITVLAVPKRPRANSQSAAGEQAPTCGKLDRRRPKARPREPDAAPRPGRRQR